MALTGSLKELSSAEIIQILALGKKNGTLRVTCDNEEGIIFFANGRAIHAVCGDIQGEEAVFKVLSYEEGYFEFELSEVDCDITITSNTESLILEAMRRSDEHGTMESSFRNAAEHFLSKAMANTDEANVLRSYFEDYYNWSHSNQADSTEEETSAMGSSHGNLFPVD